jgi:hypothetical protein
MKRRKVHRQKIKIIRDDLAGLRDEFRQRFGREPRDGDPLFWSDRSGDAPTPMSVGEIQDVVRNALKRAGQPGDDVVSRRILGLAPR